FSLPRCGQRTPRPTAGRRPARKNDPHRDARKRAIGAVRGGPGPGSDRARVADSWRILGPGGRRDSRSIVEGGRSVGSLEEPAPSGRPHLSCSVLHLAMDLFHSSTKNKFAI